MEHLEKRAPEVAEITRKKCVFVGIDYG